MPLNCAHHLGDTVQGRRQRKDGGHVVGAVYIRIAKDAYTWGLPSRGAEPAILPPVSIERQFAVHMLQPKRQLQLISNFNQLECWVAEVDFPVTDAGVC